MCAYTNRNDLERGGQHCYEHVDQNHHHDATVSAVHKFANKLCELVTGIEFEHAYVEQSVNSKIQRLRDLKKTEIISRRLISNTMIFGLHSLIYDAKTSIRGD